MGNVTLTCKTRSEKETGKNAARKLRREGMIPGNIISNAKSTRISIPEANFSKLLNGGLHQSSLIDLTVEGGEDAGKVYVKELQRHPVNGSIVHVDFYKVTTGKKVMVKIGIETEGTSKGVKAGGALEHFIRAIKIKAAPEDFQEVIKVDISDLDVDEALYLQDLGLPESWEILLRGNPIVLKIARSRLARQDAQEEGAAGAAPAGEAEKASV